MLAGLVAAILKVAKSRELARKKLSTLKIMLTYYRLQNISTCEALLSEEPEEKPEPESESDYGFNWQRDVVDVQYSEEFKQELQKLPEKYLKYKK